MGMTTLIFVRHGQSVSNSEKRFTGQHETDLTELGHRQAEATADYLEGRVIDRIYSSDLSRSMETARHTAERRGMEILPDRRFREIDAGAWEGNTYEYLHTHYPESYAKWIHDLGHAHPDGGEAVCALAARVEAGVLDVVKQNPNRCVAIFTHATPVRMMACRWFGLDFENAAQVPFCTNASVSIAEYNGEGFVRLVQYSYDEHQGDLVTRLPRGLV